MFFTTLHRSKTGNIAMSTFDDYSSAFNNRSSNRRRKAEPEPEPQEHRRSVDHLPERQTGKSLTTSLLESHPKEYKAATEAKFLRLAGAGKLSRPVLARWLSQDRLYAESYICFVSSLISRINLPYAYVPDKSESLRWRIIKLLTDALSNIQRELQFFTSVARGYDLDLETPSDPGSSFTAVPATRQYIELFRGFFLDPAVPLLEGLVVLWATEKCYLSAWKYASSFAPTNVPVEQDKDGGALRGHFIPNWTNRDFAAFVDEIAEVTDALAQREGAAKKLEVHKAVWLHVLNIEQQFWPSVDGGRE